MPFNHSAQRQVEKEEDNTAEMLSGTGSLLFVTHRCALLPQRQVEKEEDDKGHARKHERRHQRGAEAVDAGAVEHLDEDG